MARPTISLAMIVKNEEVNLPELFKSIEGCFDEVHITDTGSTDRTLEICKENNAIIHHFDWCGDFSAARNYSFSHVKTDFVMWMDGDDVLENKDAFLRFRDDVMNLADYWVATYHYSSDPAGKPVCSFVRERVFRTNKDMRWMYYLHEGIIPKSPYGQIKAQLIPTWAIRHKRTDQDIVKDRNRNLSIFEEKRKTEPLDARMTYYYGKELFEAGQPVEAANQLLLAIANRDLEVHDRLLAIQYLCYAYMACNQFQKVIEHGHHGIMLEPNRAEYHVLVGDAYLKMNNIVNAIPFFNAAKSCVTSGSQFQTSPIFKHEDAYGIYPRNQLGRIYANIGDIDRAHVELSQCNEKHPNPETHILLKEIDKIRKTVSSIEQAKTCDDIVISCPPNAPYKWDPDRLKNESCGGSETAAIEMAFWLKKLSGRNVKIFNVRDNEGVWDGVEYYPVSKLSEYMSNHKPYLHIAWRHNIKITNAPTFLWCHDLVTPGAENYTNYEKVLALTPFHKRYLQAMQGIPDHKIHTTRNGINPDKFYPVNVDAKDPNKFVFSSSPDRGLDRAMRVLDKVREKHPDIKLHVYYGIEHLDNYGLGDLRKQLTQMMSERPWVIYHGATKQDQLMREFATAAYCVQPSDWIETSKITSIEHLCTGVYQITRAVGGCVDTMKWAVENNMATLVDSECITEKEYQIYIDATLKAIEDQAYKRIKVDPNMFAWETVANEWLTDLPAIAYPGGLEGVQIA